MPPSIDKIVKVAVQKSTTPVPQAGFGYVLLLSDDTPPAGFGTATIKAYNKDDFATDFTSTSSKEAAFLRRLFSQQNVPDRAYVGFKLGTDADMTAALNRIKNVNNDWYVVCGVDALSLADNKAIADWAAANRKIAFLQDTTASTITAAETDDLGSQLMAASNDRAAVFWTENESDYLQAAVAGLCLPQDPGSLTFAFKTLTGVPVSNLMTTSAATALSNKNINYYANVANRNITFDGKMASGDYIDVTRAIDWLTARIMENVFQVIAGANKIPYTDAGVEILANAARQVLGQALERQVIAERAVVTTQPVLAIPVNDRANRVYGNIIVNCRIAGAIQTVNYQVIIGV